MTTVNNPERELQILSRYSSLLSEVSPVKATYLWLDGCYGMRSKVKTLYNAVKSLSDVPAWMYGVDWYYGPGMKLGCEARLLPVRLYPDPFAGAHHRLVLCHSLSTMEESLNQPIACNTRAPLQKVLEKVEPEARTARLGGGRISAGQKDYSHGVGANEVVGRELAEAHLQACLKAGVHLSSQSAGAVLSSWTFEIGPCDATTACDDLWMARYLLQRLAEIYSIVVSFDGGHFPGTANRSAVEFSTGAMRDSSNGKAAAEAALAKLKEGHREFVSKATQFAGYPYDVERRLNKVPGPGSKAKEEENPFDVVVREEVPVNGQKKGNFVLIDRRVPSNLDPYVVAEQLIKTVLL
ncbi:hypothetical protein TYRP_021031 [Tyrophagus putrescentiae]|nr:hypothetical protein TYRP_021031 [Tyrophagus putrescentiae]